MLADEWRTYSIVKLTRWPLDVIAATPAYELDMLLALSGVDERAGQRIAKREQERQQRRGALSRIMGKR